MEVKFDFSDTSDSHLKLVYLIVNDLAHKSELAQARGPIKFGNTPKGMNKDEQLAVLDRLERAGVLSFSNDGKSVWLNEHTIRKFSDFYIQLHDEYHKRFPIKTSTNFLQPSYDLVNGVLSIENFRIKIKIHNEDTKQNQLLRYIFIDNAKDIAREFDFTEFPFDDIGDKEKFRDTCKSACDAINKKIATTTGDKVTKFLLYNRRGFGFLQVNPIYLQPL